MEAEAPCQREEMEDDDEVREYADGDDFEPKAAIASEFAEGFEGAFEHFAFGQAFQEFAGFGKAFGDAATKEKEHDDATADGHRDH